MDLTETTIIDLRLAARHPSAETLQTPGVSRRNCLESHLRLARILEGLNPNHPELCFALPIPDRQAVLNLKRTPNRTQSCTSGRDVERVHDLLKYSSIGTPPRQLHWQNTL